MLKSAQRAFRVARPAPFPSSAPDSLSANQARRWIDAHTKDQPPKACTPIAKISRGLSGQKLILVVL